MMKRYIVIFVTLFISFHVKAQEFRSMEYNGLLYQEMICNDTQQDKLPLVIYLHGRHASGNDNQKQLSQAGVQEIEKYLRKNGLSACFLIPQCPEGQEWAGREGKPSYTDRVVELIAHYVKTKDIDSSRNYICGASMGAQGAWKLLRDNPNIFAAALIVSGQAQHAKPSNFADIPLYVTVGSKERSFEALKWFTTEIRKAGGKVKFDVLLGQRHRSACDKAFSTKRIKWLLSQEKELVNTILSDRNKI